MRKKAVFFWLACACGLIAVQGARPAAKVASTGATGVQVPSTSSTTTDGTSTGGIGDVGQPYNGTWYGASICVGPTLNEYASLPSWGSSGSGNKHTIGTTATFNCATLGQNAGWVDGNPNDPSGHFWSKGGLRRMGGFGQSPDLTVGAPPTDGAISYNGNTYNLYTNAPVPTEAQRDNASDLSDSKRVRGRSSPFNLAITNPGELGTTAASATVPMSATTTSAGVSAVITQGQTFPFQLASTGSLAANNYSVVIYANKTWHRLDKYYNVIYKYTDADGVINNAYEYTVYLWTAFTATPGARDDFNCRKLLANDASIDSRTGYGDGIAQSDTKQVGDPNASPTNYNFGSSVYHGGVFVGHSPWTSGDLSGTARAQLYLPGGSLSQTLLADLSLFYLSTPASAANAETIDVYYPTAATGTDMSAMWSNGWSLNTQGSSVTFPTSGGPSPNTWVNWPLDTTKTVLTSGLALALHDESVTDAEWKYFSSKENASGPGATFPITDSQPRVWLLDLTGSSNW